MTADWTYPKYTTIYRKNDDEECYGYSDSGKRVDSPFFDWCGMEVIVQNYMEKGLSESEAFDQFWSDLRHWRPDEFDAIIESYGDFNTAVGDGGFDDLRVDYLFGLGFTEAPAEYDDGSSSILSNTRNFTKYPQGYVRASRHWREKTECKTKNGKIVRMQNVSSIFNDQDYYILYDADGNFVEKSLDFNYLHKKLYGSTTTNFSTDYVKADSDINSVSDTISGTIQVKPGVDANTVVDIIGKYNVVENIEIIDNSSIVLSGKYDNSNTSWYMKLNPYITAAELTVDHVSLGYTTSITFHKIYWRISDNVDPQYIFRLNKLSSDTYDFMCQAMRKPDGSKKWLHNEVSVAFKLVNGEPYILSGYHIGTQDFDFDEGDSWDDCVEYYQPGITEQVLERIKNNDYEYH